MDIRMFSLQKLEKEHEELVNNKDLASFKKDLQKSKKEIQEIINSYNNMKEQQEIIVRDLKRIEDENNSFLSEIQTKEKNLYNNSDAGFKELESMKENIEELKEQYREKEEEQIELIAASEDLAEGIEKEKEVIKEKKQEFNEELKEFKKLEEINDKKIKEKEVEIQEMIQELPPEVYSKYQAVQKKYPLTGIAVLEEGNKCSYCRLNVSVVKLREVERKDITYCESCSRLLTGKKEDIK
ncbi:MAG: hypothetical protein EOM04_03570 [Clostridia bacterium]|nr:hypothetical protein [Clostridia bacterium]